MQTLPRSRLRPVYLSVCISIPSPTVHSPLLFFELPEPDEAGGAFHLNTFLHATPLCAQSPPSSTRAMVSPAAFLKSYILLLTNKKKKSLMGGLWIARLCCTYYTNAPRVSHLSLNDALGHRRGAALRHHACGQPSLPPSLLSRSQEFGARHTRAPRPRAWCRQDAALFFFKKAEIKSLPLIGPTRHPFWDSLFLHAVARHVRSHSHHHPIQVDACVHPRHR